MNRYAIAFRKGMMTVTVIAFITFSGTTAAVSGNGDAAQAKKGASLFSQRCAACHAIGDKGGRIGPDLAGVIGRKAGATTFAYSSAMKKSGLIWKEELLSAFLASPATLVPGTQMPIAVPSVAERGALIAYLRTTEK